MGYREPAALAPGRELARGRLPRALRLRPAGAGGVAQHGPALSAGTAWTAPGRSRDPGREPSRCHPPRHPRLSLNDPAPARAHDPLALVYDLDWDEGARLDAW